MINPIITIWKSLIGKPILFPFYSARKKMAYRYLRGHGLEIGALHHPLEILPGVIVKYVDYVSREENIKKYKGIDSSAIVVTDQLEDGFELSGIPSDSQDFIIANHLLEHSPNPLQVLINWNRVLKNNAIVYLTLPNGNKSFDRGRPITSISHIVEDFNLVKNGVVDVYTARNRDHYREFVEISIPNLHLVHRNLKVYRTDEEKNTYIDKLAGINSSDAHYHVFSKASFVEFINHVIAYYLDNLQLVEIVSSRGDKEFIAIIRKVD
ncbi:MAG TPA: methyltransferase domain-containing protein [Desulfuromonadaceae bacterium]|jgi:SAM-dependent methyltransferase